MLDTARLNWTYKTYAQPGHIWVQNVNLTVPASLSPCPQTIDEKDPLRAQFGPGVDDWLRLPQQYTVVRATTHQHCTLATAEYHVKVIFHNGGQGLSYEIKNEQTMEDRTRFHLKDGPLPAPMRSSQEYVNLLALFDSLGNKFAMTSSMEYPMYYWKANVKTPNTICLENGTEIKACAAAQQQALVDVKGNRL